MVTKDETLEFIASHNFDGADDRAIALMAKFFVYRAKEALAQPAQEPVGTKNNEGITLHIGWDDLPVGAKLYTTPPQRPWVGLTAEDYKALSLAVAATKHQCISIEAKLKEKNS